MYSTSVRSNLSKAFQKNKVNRSRQIKTFVFFQFLCYAVLTGYATIPVPPKNLKPPGSWDDINLTMESVQLNSFSLHDSIHLLNFRYPDGKKGLKPWITPLLLVGGGTALHFMTSTKEDVRDFMQKELPYTGHVDDYIQYAPVLAVYALNASGIKGKNNFGNRSALVVKSFLLNDLTVWQLKKHVNEKRPSGGAHSFPSGHTSRAFAFAHFMHKEYGEINTWYSIGAYSCAAAVGYMRIAKNAHWISDVVAAAGIGMLSTELVYLTHQYKWDKDHLKRFDIFPFQLANQKGFTLVYHF